MQIQYILGYSKCYTIFYLDIQTNVYTYTVYVHVHMYKNLLRVAEWFEVRDTM